MKTGCRDRLGSGVADREEADAAEAGRSPRRKRRSPQEKKALSYRCDRRDSYGENDKSSRKNVPRSKARSHRKLRHADKAALRDLDAAIETVPLRLRKPSWKKSPDTSLGLVVRLKLHVLAADKARQRGEPEPFFPGWQEFYGWGPVWYEAPLPKIR